jgi:predicted alpha/beta-fold hydrolase
LARPALILSAADDPFVPPEIFHAPAVRDNSHITTVITSCGGHCAFVESTFAEATVDKDANEYDGYFAEKTVIDFLAANL